MTLLLAISLCVPFVRASLSNCNRTTIPTLDIRDSSSICSNRTLWDILWSCAATLFACTWTAIHPNIPGVNERQAALTLRRLLIMFVTLTAPELIITWAAQQYFSASKAAADFNDTLDVQLGQVEGSLPDVQKNSVTLAVHGAAGSKFRAWTITHGFFAWMGGFLLYVNDEPRATLTPTELRRFVCDGSVEMPIIAEADIIDRSKGDVLSKGIAILQIAWFVLQIATRYVQHLPITLLEIDTLAVAALTSIAYGLWWKKPKDVGRPCPVCWKEIARLPENLKYDQADPGLVAGGARNYFWKIIYPFASLLGVVPIISPGVVHSRRVPSLGGYARTRGGIVLLVGCFSGMVFGAIHCVGWYYFFHTHTEQVLWRVASLAILCAPISTLIYYCLVILKWSRKFYLDELFRFLRLLAGFAYITARLTLIVLILLSFRTLPPGVHDTVAWTEFIPHL